MLVARLLMQRQRATDGAHMEGDAAEDEALQDEGLRQEQLMSWYLEEQRLRSVRG
jgi:hypothetical protein